VQPLGCGVGIVANLGVIFRRVNQQHFTESANVPNTAPERLHETIRRIYGPHIATLTKKTTVLYMKRLE
jgi:hypothetical protein